MKIILWRRLSSWILITSKCRYFINTVAHSNYYPETLRWFANCPASSAPTSVFQPIRGVASLIFISQAFLIVEFETSLALTSKVTRPSGSLSAAMSKNTTGLLLAWAPVAYMRAAVNASEHNLILLLIINILIPVTDSCRRWGNVTDRKCWKEAHGSG